MGFITGMRINFLPNNFTFRSNQIPTLPEEGITMGYDDSVSSKRRESIRVHLEDQAHLKYLDYYEMPKSDFAMERMLKSWGLKTDKVADKIIVPEDLNCIALGNNNFRSALPVSDRDFKRLKDAGIKTIICATPHLNIQKVCEKNGMKCINLVSGNSRLQDYIYTDYAFMDEFDYTSELERNWGEDNLYKSGMYPKLMDDCRNKSRKFIDKLTDSVKAMQEGGCLIGCEFGTMMTSQALNLIDVFNPKEDDYARKHLKFIEKIDIQNLYKKLTPEDKAKMGWTDEFEKNFQRCLVNN